MFAIYKKELRSFFINPIGYIYVGAFLGLAALVCCYTTIMSSSYSTSLYFTIMMFAMGILIPLLTMRLFAEERKLRTEQLLLTAPVSITGMVMGKFLAAFTMFSSALFVNSLYFLVLYRYAQVKTAVLIGNFIALLLVGMVFIAVGLFVSSLTENQLTAAVGTMAIILVFLAIGLINSLLPATYWLRYVFNCISIFTRFQNFSNGIFDLSSLIYYVSVCAVFIYLTIRVYDRRRYN
jgi:ABC-2 type transport system permease protein